jgi:hypothetical protein
VPRSAPSTSRPPGRPRRAHRAVRGLHDARGVRAGPAPGRAPGRSRLRRGRARPADAEAEDQGGQRRQREPAIVRQPDGRGERQGAEAGFGLGPPLVGLLADRVFGEAGLGQALLAASLPAYAAVSIAARGAPWSERTGCFRPPTSQRRSSSVTAAGVFGEAGLGQALLAASLPAYAAGIIALLLGARYLRGAEGDRVHRRAGGSLVGADGVLPAPDLSAAIFFRYGR